MQQRPTTPPFARKYLFETARNGLTSADDAQPVALQDAVVEGGIRVLVVRVRAMQGSPELCDRQRVQDLLIDQAPEMSRHAGGQGVVPNE